MHLLTVLKRNNGKAYTSSLRRKGSGRVGEELKSVVDAPNMKNTPRQARFSRSRVVEGMGRVWEAMNT